MAQVKATNVEAPRRRAQVQPTLGFGVPATSDPHHFKVLIPKSNTGKVQISEYLGLQAASSDSAVIDRVLLDRPRWTAIRGEVQRAFNARLAAHGLRSSAWKVGENAVDRLLGDLDRLGVAGGRLAGVDDHHQRAVGDHLLLLDVHLDGQRVFDRRAAPVARGGTHISPHLPTSPYISPHLPTSPHISPYLPISPYISLHLRTSQVSGVPFGLPGQILGTNADQAQALGVPVVTNGWGAMLDYTYHGVAVPPLQPQWHSLGWVYTPNTSGFVEALVQVVGTWPSCICSRVRRLHERRREMSCQSPSLIVHS